MDLLQDGAEFFVVGLVLRHDCGLQARCREVDRVELEILARCAERVVGQRVFQLERRADVAGNQLVDGVAVLAVHDEELVEALRMAGDGISQFIARVDLTRHDLEEGELAQVRFDQGLEDEERLGSFRIAGEFRRFRVSRVTVR